MRYISILSIFVIVLSSCASYNYNTSSKDRQFQIKSDNLNDFQVFFDPTSTKIATATSNNTNATLQTLKKNNLTVLLSHPNYDPIRLELKRSPRPIALVKDISLSIFTLGIPIIIDVFKSDFYRVSPKTKEFNVHFEFKQSFMKEEFEKIKNSSKPEDFQNWISKYNKSEMVQDVIDHKDSLELSIALSKESEAAVDEYISSHQSSNYLVQAQKIKAEMIEARDLYTKANVENTVEIYEQFLIKFPRSLHNTDVHKRLIDAAEKVGLSSGSSIKMVYYVNSYLIPNASFLKTNELEIKKASITKAIDTQIIKENVKADTKKTYEYYSNLWKRYDQVKTEVRGDYLTNFEQTVSYQSKICDILFTKLKEAIAADKQIQLQDKIKVDFPNLDLYDKDKNIFITVLENISKSSGTLKLFNVGFLPNYFNNMSERDALIGRSYYTYKGGEYQALKGISFEEITVANGQLSGTSKCFQGGNLDFALTILNSKPKEIAYYQSGKLVKTTTFLPDYKEYSYEFENGSNLTLKALDATISEGNKYLSNQNFDLALTTFETARKNNFPSTIAQNVSIQKNIASAKSQKAAYIQKLEKERIAEQKKKDAIEAEKRKPVVLEDYYDLWDYPSKYIGRNVAMVVWPSSGANKYVLHQREYSETKIGSTRNNMFKGTQFYIDPSELKTESRYYNWKKFTEATTQKSITVNIPDKFFDNDLIPHDEGQSYYVIIVNVYPMRESRGYGQKGQYNDNGGSASEVTYELIDIKRYKP